TKLCVKFFLPFRHGIERPRLERQKGARLAGIFAKRRLVRGIFDKKLKKNEKFLQKFRGRPFLRGIHAV
ncbi:MAG: hypothetical protein PHQ75_13760, partial [Thermoguttaceae bacterium]|nr:hypothetical protein [Thermoguttaceae bacterium]